MWTSGTSTIWRVDRIKAGKWPAQDPACRGQSALQPGFAPKPTSSHLSMVPSCSFANSQGQWTDPEAACPEEGRRGGGLSGSPWFGVGGTGREDEAWPLQNRRDTLAVGPLCPAKPANVRVGSFNLHLASWCMKGRQVPLSSCQALVLGPACWEQ